MDMWVVEEDDFEGTFVLAICDSEATARKVVDKLHARFPGSVDRIGAWTREVVTDDEEQIQKFVDEF